MNMQAFYRRLAVKPSKAHQRRLANLTHVSRAQVVNVTRETEWFIWKAEMPNT